MPATSPHAAPRDSAAKGKSIFPRFHLGQTRLIFPRSARSTRLHSLSGSLGIHVQEFKLVCKTQRRASRSGSPRKGGETAPYGPRTVVCMETYLKPLVQSFWEGGEGRGTWCSWLARLKDGQVITVERWNRPLTRKPSSSSESMQHQLYSSCG